MLRQRSGGAVTPKTASQISSLLQHKQAGCFELVPLSCTSSLISSKDAKDASKRQELKIPQPSMEATLMTPLRRFVYLHCRRQIIIKKIKSRIQRQTLDFEHKTNAEMGVTFGPRDQKLIRDDVWTKISKNRSWAD